MYLIVAGALVIAVVVDVEFGSWRGWFGEVEPGEKVVELLGWTFEQIDKFDVARWRTAEGLVGSVQGREGEVG
jgi:hypothetical protein